MTQPLKNFWLSWYSHDYGKFELYWPWWVSGYAYKAGDDGEDIEIPTICAAVRAPDEDAAREIVFSCHDERPDDIEFRFVEQEADDWSPYCDRFGRNEKWMPEWPTDNPSPVSQSGE